MKMPRFIRKNLIEPNIDELRRYGNLSAINSNSGKPGRPALRYYLNREQASLVSVFSRVPKAADVREEIIKVFSAYQDGHLVLSETGKIALPNFKNPAEAARAWAKVWGLGARRQRSTPLRKTEISITSQTGPYREKGKTVSN